MKTRYKILIVIGAYATFFFTKIEIAKLCWNELYDHSVDNSCMVLNQFVTEITPHVISNGDGIASWSGTAEGMEQSSQIFAIHDNISFLLFFIVVPFLIILVIHYRDKCTKLTI